MKGVVNEHSGKNHEYSNLLQKNEDALIRKHHLKKLLDEEKIDLQCQFYFCDRMMEKIKDLFEEKTKIYLQAGLDKPFMIMKK